MTALYSEFDPKAAAWLRELIRQGHIADGIVDERDLWDIPADYLKDFTQVHLCAGIGVWSYALRRAGWPDDRPVWTGSFPCQPFSSAGKGLGFDDERHLWPAGHWLIEQCRPAVVFGEQVASKDAEPWLDLVQADMEALAYSVGAIPFPSAGIGAPHIRDRLYWVADAMPAGRAEGWTVTGDRSSAGRSGDGRLVDPVGERRCLGQSGRQDASDASVAVEAGGLAKPRSAGTGRDDRAVSGPQDKVGQEIERPVGPTLACSAGSNPGPTNGLWRDADWLFCRDGKWRPVEPGTFPLAHGASARVGRLRGYGNAINAEAAVAWIESYLEAKGERASAGAEEADQVQA